MLLLSKGFVPANTRKNTTWAYKVLAERNNDAEEQCPEKFVLSTCISIVQLLPVLCLFWVYMYIAYCCCLRAYFLFLSSSAAFTNRLSSAVLTNRVLTVANRALNAVLAPLSAIFADRSSSAVAANCSLSSFITTRILGQYIHSHMHIQ